MQMEESPDSQPLSVVVAQNVYRLRVMKVPKWSQVTLAEKSGLSRNTIAAIEDARDPDKSATALRLDTLERIADALGVPAAELLISRVTRDGKVPHLALVASRAGPPLSSNAPIQPPLIRGVSPSKGSGSKSRRPHD